MTCQEFKDALDAILADVAAEAGPARPSASLLERAAACPCCKRALVEWTWLADQVRKLDRPKPSADFAHRVVAELKRTPAGSRRQAWADASPVVSTLGSLVAIAASIALLVVVWRPIEEGASQVQVASVEQKSPLERPAALDVPVRETTKAYLALAQDFARTVQLADPEPTDGTPAIEPEGPARDSSVPPVRSVLRRSGASFAAASEEIGSGIRPIADSAAGAFAFLWKGR